MQDTDGALSPVPSTDLFGLSSLKLLELVLKAPVGPSTGPDHLDCGQRLLPAQSRHRHDISHHQGDTAGDPCQTVSIDEWTISIMK